MPLYEYHCKECGAIFEEMARMAQADDMECIVCGSENTERLASSFCSSGGSDTASAGQACGSGG